jgi:hypothetical protein
MSMVMYALLRCRCASCATCSLLEMFGTAAALPAGCGALARILGVLLYPRVVEVNSVLPSRVRQLDLLTLK